MFDWVGAVSSGDIHYTVCAKCDAIARLSSPTCVRRQYKLQTLVNAILHTFCVESGVVENILACINVYPALAVNRIDFRPRSVFRVPYPTDTRTHGAAEHGEAISPFSASSSFSLHQDECVVVSRKALVGATVGVAAFVKLDGLCTQCDLFGCWRDESLCVGITSADRALRVVDPFEEVLIEPFQQCSNYAIFMCPSWLQIHAGSSSLEHRRFILSFSVYPFQRYGTHGFVQ